MSEQKERDVKPNLQRKDSTFEDVGNIELEFNDEEILCLSNTFKDKTIYVVFSVYIFISCYLIGLAPNYFYIWYTMLSAWLLPYRLHVLRMMYDPVNLLQSCYLGNILILIYLWYPSQILGDGLREFLFPICFSFAMGPLLFSAVVFRDSLVFHSPTHMTSIYLHMFPFFVMWGIRWYSTDDQGFGVYDHFKQGSSGNVNYYNMFGISKLVILPGLIYAGRTIAYVLITEVLLQKYSGEKWHDTLYLWSKRQGKRSMLIRYVGVFGKKYEKAIFYFCYIVGPSCASVLGYFCMNSKVFASVLGVMVVVILVYNGASFYIDYFSRHYYASQVLKEKYSPDSQQKDTTLEETLCLSNTFKDKAIYVIFTVVVFITLYLIGLVPNYFYIWYTMVAAVILSYHLYYLKKMNKLMNLLFFCYYGNVFILVYLWYPSQFLGDGLRNILFPICFSFVMGPVLISSLVLQNAFVFHSTSHMTSIYLHLYPFLTMWGIRWYSTEDQGFLFMDSNGISTPGIYELVILPSLIYVVWIIAYILIAEVLLQKYYSGEIWYNTYYLAYKSQGKRSILIRYAGVFGKKYEKVVLYFYIFVGPMSTIFFGYFLVNSKVFASVLGFTAVLILVYNGASFYIDYFSRHYYAKRVLNLKEK